MLCKTWSTVVLSVVRGCSGICALLLVATAIIGWRAADILPLQLIPHHPWDVRFGKVARLDRDRIYVHARIDNTTNDTILFQEYGKAILKDNPSSIALLQDPEIINALKDDVRRLASADDAPVITANPHADEPATFDISSQPATTADYAGWKSGSKILYYDTLVYVKLEPSGIRFAFDECYIARTIPNIVAIPDRTPVEVSRQLSETPCNFTNP